MEQELRVLYETDNPLFADDYVRRVKRLTNCDLYYRRDIALDGKTAYYAILGPAHLHRDFYHPPDFKDSPDSSDDVDQSDTSMNRITTCADCSGTGDAGDGDGYCTTCDGDGFLQDG